MIDTAGDNEFVTRKKTPRRSGAFRSAAKLWETQPPLEDDIGVALLEELAAAFL